MSQFKLLEPEKSYTFRNYFEMTYEPEDILAEFGFSLQRCSLDLPKSNINRDRLAELKNNIQRRLPYVSLTSEAARREILIAPILLTLIDYTRAQLRIEYPLKVSEQLKGSLDYYLHTQHPLLVIEAKNADLARGFTQLAVELIALDIIGCINMGAEQPTPPTDRSQAEPYESQRDREPSEIETVKKLQQFGLSNEQIAEALDLPLEIIDRVGLQEE